MITSRAIDKSTDRISGCPLQGCSLNYIMRTMEVDCLRESLVSRPPDDPTKADLRS